MQIVGVAPLGANGVRSMTVQVVETRPPAAVTVPNEPAPSAGQHPGRLAPEAVVFPRDPNRLDPRPVDQRRRKAAARYAEDGGPASGSAEPQAPVREERHRRG